MIKSSDKPQPPKPALNTTYSSGIAQASAYRIIKKHTANTLREYNLSCMQWFTIGTIYEAGSEGIRLTDLAKKLDTTLAYMTNIVNLLESRGILEKRAHDNDARTKLIAIEPSYRKKCEEIEAHLRKSLSTLLYSRISNKELHTYIDVLYKINSAG